MKRKLLHIASILAILFGCVDPFEIENLKDNDLLVVEGVVSDIFRRHTIQLSRTTALGDNRFEGETGAEVWIIEDNSVRIDLVEESPGIYLTPEFAAGSGKSYVLNIKTADGATYSSVSVPFQDGPEVTNFYPRYEVNRDGEKGVTIYVDTEDPQDRAQFYRWNWVETYRVHAPFPSNWVWLGGNEVEFRWHGIDTCYVTDTLRNILTRTTRNQDVNRITAQPLRFISEMSYILRFEYSMLVQQFAMSEDAFLYWENVRIASEKQGSLSDIQPGSLPGNVVSLTDPNETVLGLFEVCKVSERRIIFSYLNFFDEGFLRPPPMRGGCYDILPIDVHQSVLGEAMQQYQDNMYIWEVSGFTPFAYFHLMPKSCCDCRDLGPTDRPAFLD